MNKIPSTTCARHDDGTASELWRSLSYQVGDVHAHRICRCIDVYCRIVGLPVERLRSHVPGQTPAGPTPQKAVVPRSRPVLETLDKVKKILPSALARIRGGKDRQEGDRIATMLRDLFIDLEDAIDVWAGAERRENPMRVVEVVGLGRLPDLVPAEPWEVVGDAKSAWITTQRKRLFVLGPLSMAVPALRLVCDLVNEARAVVQSTQVPSKAREELADSDAYQLARAAIPWSGMTVDEARMRVARVFRALHTHGVQAAWKAATPGKFFGPKGAANEKPDTDRGLYPKYRVERTDGSSAPGQRHHGCEYFVLDLEHDPHALPALRAYSMSCARYFPALASDLSKKALRLADRWTNAGAEFASLTGSILIDPEKARAIVGWTDDDKPR